MGKKPRGPPVLSLSAAADSSSPGQKAVLATSLPVSVLTIDDVPEFQEEMRQRKQATQMQGALQVIMIGTLIFRWFRGRNNSSKPKKPRTPPSNN
jgi:hypothetical protein